MYKFLNKRGLSGYVNEMIALPQPTLDRIGKEKEKNGRESLLTSANTSIHLSYFKQIFGVLIIKTFSSLCVVTFVVRGSLFKTAR